MGKITKLADAKPKFSAPSAQWPEMSNGRPRSKSQANIVSLLNREQVSLRLNSFSLRVEVTIDGTTEALGDGTLRRLYLLAHRAGLDPTKEFFSDVICEQARLNTYHPVRDYLGALEWDREQRLDHWLVDYLGAENTELNRYFGAKTLIAAVRRVRKPGCKFDQALILEGAQGAGKSTAVRLLAGEAWFTDCLNVGADPKVVIEQTEGKWFAELAELAGLRKGEVEAVKAMISRREDRARLAFKAYSGEVPRQFIMFGTVNGEAYLRDITGNRRFWPVKVGTIDLGRLAAERDQLWAEAAFREAMGESIELPGSLWAVAAEEQAKRLVVDPFEEQLEPVLLGKRGHVPKAEVWDFLQIKSDKRDPHMGQRVTGIMARLGFKSTKRRKEGEPLPCYSNDDGGAWFTLLSNYSYEQ